MAEVVDSIVAQLEARLGNYVRDFNLAADAHERFTRTRPDRVGQFSPQQVEQYANRHRKSADDVAQAEEQTTARVTRTRRARADAAIAQDEREVRAARAAAKEKADAEIAEAQRAARLSAVAQRAADRAAIGVPRATSSSLGQRVAREATGQRSIPSSVLNGDAAADVAAEREINQLMAQQAELQSRLSFARGRDRDIIREQIGEIRLRTQLEKAGLEDAAIAARLEERRLFIDRQRAAQARGQANRGLEQFARGAGLSAATGGAAAGAGIAVAVGVGVGAAVIQSAVDYGKALDNLSKQLGITTTDLQAYLKIARDTGVEQETLSSAFGQFASNLGRAQQGQEEYAKVFKALGIDIRNFSSAGDALPTVIDRISQLKDPLQRAAIETRLFGEEGRKLDQLLSGGPQAVSALAASLQETGQALSQREIQELDDTARKLADVKNQLSVDFARIVSGNSDAIIGLANSFAQLAARVTDAIGKLQQFGAKQVESGFISNFAGDGDKARARQFRLGTRTGRVQLFQEAEARERELLAGNGSFSTAGGVRGIERQRAAALEQVRAEKAEIARAEAASRAKPTAVVQTGAVNGGLLQTLGAPKPAGGVRGNSADRVQREEEQRARQFNDQLAAAQQDFLRAQQQMTGSIDARADIELQMLERARDARLADIENQRKRNVASGASAKLEQARADELAAAENKAFNANREVIEQERTLDANRARAAIAATLLDADQTVLSAQLSMAQSTQERRDIELRLLANAKEQERQRLQGIVSSSKPESPEAANANAQLGTLDQRYGAQERDVRFRNRSALDQYRESLPDTAAKMNDALDSVKVRGLQSLDDALTDSISKVFKLGGAFGSVANQIISDLIRIGVQKAIIGPLANSLFGGGEALGGLIGGIFGGSGSIGARAAGGNVVGGTPYVVGENGPEIFAPSASGRVYPTGAIPALASGGSAQVTQYISVDGRNSVTPAGFAEQILQAANAHANRAAATAGRSAVEASPQRVSRVQTLGS